MLLSAIVVGLMASALAVGGTITVCGDGSGMYTTIQGGINAATGTDEVVVCPGVYTMSVAPLNFHGKAITVRSADDDPATCLIVGGVVFSSGEGTSSVLRGFSIQGTGVGCAVSAPTIENCWISGAGVGIDCEMASPTINGCTIFNNSGSGVVSETFSGDGPILSDTTISGNGGHGITCSGSGGISLVVDDCLIAGNTGDGIRLVSEGASGSITDSTIEGNGGRGIYSYVYGGQPTISRCIISGNLSGGIHWNNYDESVNISHCVIADNSASDSGGGIACINSVSAGTVFNCLLSGNSTGQNGGGVYCSGGQGPNIVNSTFYGNSAAGYGGGICCSKYNVGSVSDCILWSDSAANGDEIAVLNEGITGAQLTVAYSDLELGASAFFVESGCALNLGSGNIFTSPLFVAGPAGCYYLSQTAAGQGQQSPCVDAGSTTAAGAGLTGRTTRTDETGDGGTVDLGYHHAVTGAPMLGGDFNFDGVVDAGDYADFANCFSGPCVTPPCTIPLYDGPCCGVGDFEGDGDIDLIDFAGFQAAFTD